MADDENEVADRAAERARLLALRAGVRTNAWRIYDRLDGIFAMDEMYPDQESDKNVSNEMYPDKVYELEFYGVKNVKRFKLL